MNSTHENKPLAGNALYGTLILIAALALASFTMQIFMPQALGYWLGYLLLISVGVYVGNAVWILWLMLISTVLNIGGHYLAPHADPDIATFNLAISMAVVTLVGLAGWGYLMREKWHLAQFDKLAKIDSLTGLPNQLAVLEMIDRQERLASRYNTPFSLLVLDIDKLDAINAKFGRARGDRIIVDLPEAVSDLVRDTDYLGRMDAGQYVLMCTETNLNGAKQLAARIIERIAAVPSMDLADVGRVTVSIGIVEYAQSLHGVEPLLKVLALALQKAKSAGGNRVVSYPFVKRDNPPVLKTA